MSPRRHEGPLSAIRQREYVEMVDGRVYFSDDNWTTVWLIPVGGRGHQIKGKEADLARFLAVAQSSGGPA